MSRFSVYVGSDWAVQHAHQHGTVSISGTEKR